MWLPGVIFQQLRQEIIPSLVFYLYFIYFITLSFILDKSYIHIIPLRWSLLLLLSHFLSLAMLLQRNHVLTLMLLLFTIHILRLHSCSIFSFQMKLIVPRLISPRENILKPASETFIESPKILVGKCMIFTYTAFQG